jgi:DNA-binding XRE family transcriptional regulator
LARLLGFRSEVPVSRHEHSSTAPDLQTALSYEAIFRVPISELFPGAYRVVLAGIEEQLASMEEALQQSTVKGRGAAIIARKLEFLCERKIQKPN